MYIYKRIFKKKCRSGYELTKFAELFFLDGNVHMSQSD